MANASSTHQVATVDATGAGAVLPVAGAGGAAGVEAVFAQGSDISQQAWQGMLERQVTVGTTSQ